MAVSSRAGFSLTELVVVVAIGAFTAAISLSAVQRVRESANRAKCINAMRQIAVACQGYHDNNNAFPPGCRGDDSPQPYLSWLARLLPFLEQKKLYDDAVTAFQTARFFEEPPHLPILSLAMPAFVCPSDGKLVSQGLSIAVGFTSYQGVSGRSMSTFDGMLFLNSHLRVLDIGDGSSSTLLFGERPPSQDELWGWWYAGWGVQRTGTGDLFLGVRERPPIEYSRCAFVPSHFVAGRDSECDAFHFWSRHPGGSNFTFCDGSVRFLAYSADAIMPALATRCGGETVAFPE